MLRPMPKNQEPEWEVSYRTAGRERLWPADPTIQGLDLELLRGQGVRIVLDAGCGDGKNLVHLVENGFFPVGADASITALRSCHAYMQERGLNDRYLLLGPTALQSLPFLSSTFNAAICIDVLGHLPEPLTVLSELGRVLNSNGILYASVFDTTDSCRTGPRMRPGNGPNQYWYHPNSKEAGAPLQEYYYRFYDKTAAQALFEASPFRLIDLTRQAWKEPAHKGFREEPHEHVSWFGFLKKC